VEGVGHVLSSEKHDSSEWDGVNGAPAESASGAITGGTIVGWITCCVIRILPK
jgi:hypothetical protein